MASTFVVVLFVNLSCWNVKCNCFTISLVYIRQHTKTHIGKNAVDEDAVSTTITRQLDEKVVYETFLCPVSRFDGGRFPVSLFFSFYFGLSHVSLLV